ncbi:class I SAM-dependent methyltransferase [Flindersiella endophytica]
MKTDKVDFTDIKWGSVQWTMLVTLYLRAYESRNQPSIIGDRAAAEAVDRIEYDFDRMKRAARPASTQYTVALRAKQFDEWTVDFLQRHPDAVVLHLGCGLDSRAFRLDLRAGVTWYDVDVPQVIELRRRIYEETDQYRMIGSSVTEAEWLAKIPAGRPLLMVAEGLLMYLKPEPVRQLLQRLTDKFPSGELLFDVGPVWGARLSKMQDWGVGDVHEIERWNPRLRLQANISVVDGYDRIPDPRYRRFFRILRHVPGVRSYVRELRFTF